MKRTIHVLASFAVTCLAGCGGDEGFRDVDRLVGSIKEKAQSRITNEPETFGRGTKVKSLACVEGPRERIFKCAGELSTGERYSMIATVSEDGNRYVTD